MRFDRRRRVLVLSAIALGAAGCAAHGASAAKPTDPSFPNIPYASWTDEEPDYRLYPGDEIEIVTPSAPELTRTLKVGPDGRVAMPLIAPVMAADRSTPELEQTLSEAYATRLVRPAVEVTLKQAAPLKVFVGGEVNQSGVYEMPGDIDALQAVIMAGGFKTSGKRNQVVILRRTGQGGAMMRTVDLSRAAKGSAGSAAMDRAPLRRFDIVYVPRTAAAEVGAFMQQIRDALPLSFSYSLNSPYR
jgi:protein involved in polysaccharide export with SLBB domain